MKALVFLACLPVCSFALPTQFQLSINKPDVTFNHVIETTVHSHHCVGGADTFNNQFFSGTNGPSGIITVAPSSRSGTKKPECSEPSIVINIWDSSRSKHIGQFVYEDDEGLGPCGSSSVTIDNSNYELNLQRANCDSNKPELTVMVDGPQ